MNTTETEPMRSGLPVHPCPTWCDGRADRHARWADECEGDVSCHERGIGEIALPPIGAGRPRFSSASVRISMQDDDGHRSTLVSVFTLAGQDFSLTTGEARSLASMLTRAADVAELGL